MTLALHKSQQHTLWIFLLIVAWLIALGLIFVYSSSSIFALEKHGCSEYFVIKQSWGICIGLIGFILIQYLPFQLLKRLIPLFFFFTIAITALTIFPSHGIKVHGSQRWLSLLGVSGQPSELLKVSFILYLAYFLDKNKQYAASLYHGYIPFLLIIGIVVGVLLLQPDFGQAITIAATAFLLYFITQTDIKNIAYTALACIPIVASLIFFKPYRFQRILTFLNPWKDPQGSGFQIIQSLIAIGSGGLTGIGIAQSRQKYFYLPMQHTDFIFSIICEETGLIGATSVIGCYLAFTYFGIKLAWHMKNYFCMLVTLGFVLLIATQSLINILVAVGLIPTKGICLPFISYGKSALIANLFMVALIAACVKNDSIA